MSAPPPPPPPAPPPPPFGASSQGRTAPVKPKQQEPSSRAALLSDIHKGARLKKVAEVNDRSAPQIEGGRKNSSSGNGRGAVLPPTGGLFSGGFPVLKPSGQRDASGTKSALQLPGQRTSFPKYQDTPKPANTSAPATIAHRVAPPRPNILGSSTPPPPPTPPSSSKPQMVVLPSPAHSPFKERPKKAGNPPPLPPSLPQSDKPSKFQGPPSYSFPPASGSPRRNSEYSSSSPTPLEPRDSSPNFPPPPPPPQTSDSTLDLYDIAYSPPDKDFPSAPNFAPPPPPPPPCPPPIPPAARRRLSEPFPPPPNLFDEQSNTPPQRPIKPPHFANVKQAVLPQPPQGRMQRGAAPGGARLAPPPIPPARAPTTELSNRQPNNQGQSSSPHRYPVPKTGGMQFIDDFESKFTFHPVEELPPPDRFEPYEHVYPSKISSIQELPPPPPPVRYQMR